MSSDLSFAHTAEGWITRARKTCLETMAKKVEAGLCISFQGSRLIWDYAPSLGLLF